VLKFIIPIILVFTVVVAGVFAFVPIDNASTVHTTIMANNLRLDEITVAATAADQDLTITCPNASDGCRILEIYFRENDGVAGAGADIDLGAYTATINGVASVVQTDLNTQVSETQQAVGGVSGAVIGGGDTLVVDIEAATSESATYSAVIFIEVEGNTSAAAAFA